ncbi:hypothetical protein Tco_1135092 [Tanacetum coccineum]
MFPLDLKFGKWAKQAPQGLGTNTSSETRQNAVMICPCQLSSTSLLYLLSNFLQQSNVMLAALMRVGLGGRIDFTPMWGADHNKRTCPGRFKGHGEGDVVQESVNVQEGGVVAQESVDVQKEGIVCQESIDIQEEGGVAPETVDVQEEGVVAQESVEVQEERESSSEDDE